MSNDVQEEIAGAPLETAQPEMRSTLDGFGPDRIVSVFNPLSVPFRAKFARSVTQAPTLDAQQRRMAELGVPVTKDGNPQAHMSQYLVMDPGQTLNLPGDVAQVVVRQLVNVMLQRRNKGGKSYMLADPMARQDAEREVIINFSQVMQEQTQTSEQIFEQQLKELNTPKGEVVKEKEVETEFPSEGGSLPQETKTGNTDGAGKAEPVKEPVPEPSSKK